jgi:hypothetical protein
MDFMHDKDLSYTGKRVKEHLTIGAVLLPLLVAAACVGIIVYSVLNGKPRHTKTKNNTQTEQSQVQLVDSVGVDMR